jgi:hypothetical protein
MKDKAPEKVLDLLAQVRALAQASATGGERAVAQDRLDALLKKYGVSEAELELTERRMYWFRFHSHTQKRLLVQLAHCMGAEDGYRRTRGKGRRTLIGFKLTPAQKIDLEAQFKFYSALWEDEVEDLLIAFANKHRLYPADGGNGGTIEDEDRINKIPAMMGGLSDRKFRKQLRA